MELKDRIEYMIKETLGKYDEEVETVIWAQIHKIIKQTGKFNTDDYILQIIRPHSTLRDGVLKDHDYVFSIDGAVRLIPKTTFVNHVKDEILVGADIGHYQHVRTSSNAQEITIEGIQEVGWVDGNNLRFRFSLEISSSDPRIHNYIDGKLEYKSS